MRNLWRDHSLSICNAAAGLTFFGLAYRQEEFNWFDTWLGLFHAAFFVGCMGLLQGPLRERNRPED